MATAAERKFTSLRKRLDQLGYRQPLGIESLPLVEKLFGDLLHTTESLKGAKQQLGKQKEQKVVWEQHVEPYKTDNARLVKENNELHQQLISKKEAFELRVRELKVSLRRLEHENADLKFLNTQYMQKLRSQEKESQAKTEKILELQEKNFQAVIQTPGGKKKHIPFRRQRMDIDSTLPESRHTSSIAPSQPLPTPDPYVVDLLQVADQRIADMQTVVEQGEKERNKLEQSLQFMRKQVENREREIERLTGLLKGGRPPEALAAEGSRQSNERMVAHLNIQVDFLQQANRELERKLSSLEAERSELGGQKKELEEKNSRICSELQEIGDLVKQMEAEREGGEADLRETIEKLQREKSRLVEVSRDLDSRLNQLQVEKEEMMSDNRRMAEMLATSEGDTREVADMLERLSQERKDLQRQCRQLRDKELILQQRIKELESSHGPRMPHDGGTSVASELRRERDELKDAVSNFETELMEIQMDSKRLAEDRDNFKLLYQQVTDELSRVRQQSRTGHTSSVATILRRVEGERDSAQLELSQVKSECRSLKERLRMAQDTQQRDLGALEDKIAELQLQLDEVCSERDELTSRVTSLRDGVKSLEAELHNSSEALAAANAEAARYRMKSAHLQGLVETSERSKQEQQRDLRRHANGVHEAQTNIATLNNKIAQLERSLVDREEKISELRHALTMLDQDHDTLRVETDAKDETISQLKDQIREKEASVAQMESRLTQLELEVSTSRGQCGGKEREVESLQRQLEGAVSEGEQLRMQLRTVTQQVEQLRQDLTTMTQENQAIHDELRHVLEQKSSLELKVQEYAQSVLRYEEALAVKEQEKAELLESYQSLSQEADRLDSTVQQSLGETSTARHEVATLAQEKVHLEEVIQQQATEIVQHLQKLQVYELQLSNLTAALGKLESALRQEQEEKKALISDVATTRELCIQLQRSKDSLTRQLSSQSAMYEELQSRVEDLQAEKHLLKQQLDSERSSVEKLQSLLSTERKKEFQNHMTTQERETEIQHLRQQLARLEADRLSLTEQLRTLRSEAVLKSEEVQRLKSELSSVKFQREHAKQQLNLQRSQLTQSPASQPQTSPRQQSPQQQSPQQQPPEPDSLDGDEMFTRETENMASESAKLVGELLSHSSSSTHSSTPSSHSNTSLPAQDKPS